MLGNPDFVEAEERRLVALSRDFTLDTRTEIPGLWNDFWARKWELPGQDEQACYGASYAARPDGQFSYAVGLSVEAMPEALPDGACVVTLSAGRYAVFRNKGPVREIPALFDAIFSQWFPRSGHQQREGATFERYPFEDGASPESMTYEIWVPVAG